MAYEHKPGSGSAFQNTDKQEEKHPDWTGPYKGHDGKMYRIAMWQKFDKNNNPYFSFALSEHKEKTINNGGYMPSSGGGNPFIKGR